MVAELAAMAPMVARMTRQRRSRRQSLVRAVRMLSARLRACGSTIHSEREAATKASLASSKATDGRPVTARRTLARTRALSTPLLPTLGTRARRRNRWQHLPRLVGVLMRRRNSWKRWMVSSCISHRIMQLDTRGCSHNMDDSKPRYRAMATGIVLDTSPQPSRRPLRTHGIWIPRQGSRWKSQRATARQSRMSMASETK